MTTVDDRVSRLEARMDDHTRGLNDLRQAYVDFEARIDRRFESIDRRFESIDRRFDAIDRRFDAIDQRFDSLDAKFSRLTTLLVTSLTAMMVVLGGIVAALLRA